MNEVDPAGWRARIIAARGGEQNSNKLAATSAAAQLAKGLEERTEAARVALAKPTHRVDLNAPVEVARSFCLDRYSFRCGGKHVPTLRRWRGDWYRWTATHYAEVSKEELEAELYGFLNGANSGELKPRESHVNNILHALRSVVRLGDEVEAETWLDDQAPWGEGPIICVGNGVLRLSDRHLWPHDPRLFVLNSIETEYRPEAEAPRFLRFLDELWGEDGEDLARRVLQQWFGLVLTDETRFQKGLIIVGPARSGKGTIARVLYRLLGPKNYCGPSLNQLSQQFGMQSLIGKKLAVVPDARLDNRANRSVITEKLLSIIGEDPQEVNRKNKDYWSGILRLRVMILSNELPDFKDDSGVIATRFLILQTVNSYLGREDIKLDETLGKEMSGVLNWALDGLEHLNERGKFTTPGNGELNEELSSIASAVKAFANECCELGDGDTVPCEELYRAYQEWCKGNGAQSWADRLPSNQFSGKLKSAFPGQIETSRPRGDDPRRPRVFSGIRLVASPGRTNLLD
jgi:putative DNA primase/helicase